jgi:hypothetical protein
VNKHLAGTISFLGILVFTFLLVYLAHNQWHF